METNRPANWDRLVDVDNLRTVLDHVLGRESESSGGVADSGHGRDLDWAAATDLTRRGATYLEEVGVRPGARVAGYLENGVDGVLAWWATNLLGAVWAPLNRDLDEATLRHELALVEPDVVVTSTAERVHLEALAPNARVVVVEADEAPTLADAVGCEPWDGRAPVLDDAALVLFSSGTTGLPKGCLISHGYLANYARLGLQNVCRSSDDVVWTPLPMFHLAGLGHVVQSAMCGARTVLARRFSVRGFWPEVAASGATVAALMSSMIPRIGHSEAAPDGPHRLATVTGEPFPEELRDVWRRRFGITRTGSVALGQTEAGFLTTLRDYARRPGTCGLATDSFELDVVDEDGRSLPAGTAGELVCRPLHPHAMFSGYLAAPPSEGTSSAVGETWWHTGDVVRRDDDGYVYFVDRGVDRIRKGGENVSSAMVEAAAISYPGVAEAAAVGIPADVDDHILLVVTTSSGETLDVGALDRWLSDRLPRFARPDYIDVVDELPLAATSKVLKRVLRDRGVRPGIWAVC